MRCYRDNWCHYSERLEGDRMKGRVLIWPLHVITQKHGTDLHILRPTQLCCNAAQHMHLVCSVILNLRKISCKSHFCFQMYTRLLVKYGLLCGWSRFSTHAKWSYFACFPYSWVMNNSNQTATIWCQLSFNLQTTQID